MKSKFKAPATSPLAIQSHPCTVVEFETKSKHYQEALFTANWVREQEEATTRHSGPSA